MAEETKDKDHSRVTSNPATPVDPHVSGIASEQIVPASTDVPDATEGKVVHMNETTRRPDEPVTMD